MRYTIFEKAGRTEYTSEDKGHHAVLIGTGARRPVYTVRLWVGDVATAVTRTSDLAFAEAICIAHASKSNPPPAPEPPLAQ